MFLSFIWVEIYVCVYIYMLYMCIYIYMIIFLLLNVILLYAYTKMYLSIELLMGFFWLLCFNSIDPYYKLAWLKGCLSLYSLTHLPPSLPAMLEKMFQSQITCTGRITFKLCSNLMINKWRLISNCIFNIELNF